MSNIEPQLLHKLSKPAPRYTSYPTAPEWSELAETTYVEKLLSLAKDPTAPLSLYFHIPFCASMCLYCGCSVLLNRKPENEERYVNYLIHEIDLVVSYIGQKRSVRQLHFGGGTPTKLSIPQFARLFEKISNSFSIDFSQEIAIEIDPRTVLDKEGEKLRFLHQLGFNRVSFGVQDTDPKVQRAVKRDQSYEMTLATYQYARALGFKGINIDLIYGLPFQTVSTFRKTVSDILSMRPDRISLFSYAKVPWLKPHQKAIKEKTLPSTEEKFQIYSEARQAFVEAGYVAIGMDHFALEGDEIAKSYRNKTLQRNFQGYTVKRAEEMISFGTSSIGSVQNTYIQNHKELSSYYQALDQGLLPVHKGKVLTEEDILRKWVIHTLMCDLGLDKTLFSVRFSKQFDRHFQPLQESIKQLERDGLIADLPEKIVVTPLGELFIRNVAMTFDAYLGQALPSGKFSQSV